MGRLVYDQVASVEFDDRLLLHFQIVIGIKLRRRESFYFSWRDEQTVGKGRQLEFEVDVDGVQESTGPGGVTGRPWGPLEERLASLVVAAREYTTGLLNIAADLVGEPVRRPPAEASAACKIEDPRTPSS